MGIIFANRFASHPICYMGEKKARWGGFMMALFSVGVCVVDLILLTYVCYQHH